MKYQQYCRKHYWHVTPSRRKGLVQAASVMRHTLLVARSLGT